MRKPQRLLALILLLALCATALAGCGKTLADENGFVRIPKEYAVPMSRTSGITEISAYYS